MMKKYEEPKVDLVNIDDVITSSGCEADICTCNNGTGTQGGGATGTFSPA